VRWGPITIGKTKINTRYEEKIEYLKGGNFTGNRLFTGQQIRPETENLRKKSLMTRAARRFDDKEVWPGGTGGDQYLYGRLCTRLSGEGRAVNHKWLSFQVSHTAQGGDRGILSSY